MIRQHKQFFTRLTSSEERNERAEEPDQRRRRPERECLVRHETLRFLVLAVSFLALFLSFLSFLLIHTVVPLFASIVLIPLAYGCLDRYFRASEHLPLL